MSLLLLLGLVNSTGCKPNERTGTGTFKACARGCKYSILHFPTIVVKPETGGCSHLAGLLALSSGSIPVVHMCLKGYASMYLYIHMLTICLFISPDLDGYRAPKGTGHRKGAALPGEYIP